VVMSRVRRAAGSSEASLSQSSLAPLLTCLCHSALVTALRVKVRCQHGLHCWACNAHRSAGNSLSGTDAHLLFSAQARRWFVPVCGVQFQCQSPSPVLHAEFQALDNVGYTNAVNFYRCVAESADQPGVPVRGEGACGGSAQPCCNTGNTKSQCGASLACNYRAHLALLARPAFWMLYTMLKLIMLQSVWCQMVMRLLAWCC
jgi:hypothetical protein